MLMVSLVSWFQTSPKHMLLLSCSTYCVLTSVRSKAFSGSLKIAFPKNFTSYGMITARARSLPHFHGQWFEKNNTVKKSRYPSLESGIHAAIRPQR